jgi:hypothetical protein
MEKITSENLRDFLSHQLPQLSEDELGDAIKQVGIARDQYARYALAKRQTKQKYTYRSKRTSCKKMLMLSDMLKDELQTADLMVQDELHGYIGEQSFLAEITAYLQRLNTACSALEKTLPHVKGGRPPDRILYDWMLSMIDIFEGLFDPRELTHYKNGKFMKFLQCWKPDGLPLHGDPLSPKTLQRVIRFRSDYKNHLRNVFRSDAISKKHQLDKVRSLSSDKN